MEFRRLGASGFKVPVLSLGTGTFGGGRAFDAWGASDVAEARRGRHLPRCRRQHVRLGRHLFGGLAEEILGEAIKGRRDRSSSRPRRPSAAATGPTTSARRASICWRRSKHSLQRLETDYIDLYPAARLRRDHAGRGDAAHAGRSGARGQDPLHRLLELLRLAPDEVAGGLRAVRLARATSRTRRTTRWSAATTNGS